MMYKETKSFDNKLFYLNEILWHFRNNKTLNEEYTLDYDLYKKFINFLFSEVNKIIYICW